MFDALFTDPDVDQIFTDEAIMGAMLRFEGALVQAQADLHLIPSQPADLIAHVCLNAQIDADKIIASARGAGNPAIPLVRELSELVSSATISINRVSLRSDTRIFFRSVSAIIASV